MIEYHPQTIEQLAMYLCNRIAARFGTLPWNENSEDAKKGWRSLARDTLHLVPEIT